MIVIRNAPLCRRSLVFAAGSCPEGQASCVDDVGGYKRQLDDNSLCARRAVDPGPSAHVPVWGLGGLSSGSGSHAAFPPPLTDQRCGYGVPKTGRAPAGTTRPTAGGSPCPTE